MLVRYVQFYSALPYSEHYSLLSSCYWELLLQKLSWFECEYVQCCECMEFYFQVFMMCLKHKDNLSQAVPLIFPLQYAVLSGSYRAMALFSIRVTKATVIIFSFQFICFLVSQMYTYFNPY
jgi:hypothetical protein